LEEKDTKGVIR